MKQMRLLCGSNSHEPVRLSSAFVAGRVNGANFKMMIFALERVRRM